MRQAIRGVILGSAALVSAAALVTLGGCADITPELDTMSQRPADVNNRMAITTDTNLRQLNEDLGRAFFFDRPMRTTPGPIPY
jgi:hypothetical protein